MDILKKFFPLSFKNNDTLANLIIGIIVYLLGAVVAGVILGLVGIISGLIPVIGLLVGILLGAIGAVVEIYVFAGIVIKLLVYFKVLK